MFLLDSVWGQQWEHYWVEKLGILLVDLWVYDLVRKLGSKTAANSLGRMLVAVKGHE